MGHRKRKAVGLAKQGVLFGSFGWGGRREGAGRKSWCLRKGYVSHRRRDDIKGHNPIHVTCRIADGLPSMRSADAIGILKSCFTKACDVALDTFRIIHYSVQSNHLHFIVEATDKRALTAGMRGLMVRIAHGLNRLWKRCGTLFPERYHAVILDSPRQVKNAINYVLNNARHHGHRFVEALDQFASGHWFDGWSTHSTRSTTADADRSPVRSPKTWLLSVGWRRHGSIDPFAVPG